MKSFNCINCGECCGPVPVTEQELKRIQKELKNMSKEKVLRLKNQKRPTLMCMFRDMAENKCSIYSVRPILCRMFGTYSGMVCPNNPRSAVIGHKEGMERLLNNGKLVGILSIQYTWDNII